MNDEVFVYKCPSCSGKVEYDENNHKWICEYCGNSYDALFATKETSELPSMNDIKYTYYCHFCTNCNSKFLSQSKENAICTKCNTQCTGIGKETIVSKVLKLDFDAASANMFYYNEIKRFKNRIDRNYFDNDFKLEFINCDLYNGCIKICNDNNAKKYIFMNLLIPNIEYEDYRFMYEVGNIGIRSSNNFSRNNNENIESIINDNIGYFSNIEDINYVDSIIQACANDFIKSYNVKDTNSIVINNNLSVSDGVYVPVYRKTIDNENQYVFGNGSAMKQCIVQFPEKKNNRTKTRIYKIIADACKTLSFLSFVGIWYLMRVSSSIALILLMILILSIIFYFTFDYFYNYYIRTIKITRNDYFKQIINNSNYVKSIKVKR